MGKVKAAHATSCARLARKVRISSPSAFAVTSVSRYAPRRRWCRLSLEGGWDSLWTPKLDPFSGGCDYDCNRCGQTCPSQAIPPLSLEEKRKAVIGIAQVDFETCVRCMDCVQYCPYKCFEEVEVEGIRGVFPKVIPADCVGCGICVEVCPAQDDLAIVVYPVDAVPEDKHITHPAS